uniref:Nicotinamide N-methyltransferase n=1 Tax=Pseudonaja textilis TaxID=8673 RepID=A0A670YDS5_PSETE
MGKLKTGIPQKEEKVRRAVKRYLKCDVTQPNPLAPLVLPPADCLLSSLCFDAACKDIPTYQSAFRNISSLLKPGGHLLFCSTLEEHYYTVGQRKFSALYLEKEMVEEAVRQAAGTQEAEERTGQNWLNSISVQDDSNALHDSGHFLLNQWPSTASKPACHF